MAGVSGRELGCWRRQSFPAGSSALDAFYASAKTNADTGSTDWTLVEEPEGRLEKKEALVDTWHSGAGMALGFDQGHYRLGLELLVYSNYDGGEWTSLNRQVCYVICVRYKRPRLSASIRRRLAFPT